MVAIWCDMKRCKWHSLRDDWRCDRSEMPKLESGVCSKLEARDMQASAGRDAVSHPTHYAGDGVIECKDAIRSMMTGAEVTPSQAFWWGNLMKYIWRWPYKHGREDLEKARECIDNLLEDK